MKFAMAVHLTVIVMEQKGKMKKRFRKVLTIFNLHFTTFLPSFQIRQFSGAVISTKGHFMTEAEKGKGGYVLTQGLPLSIIMIIIILAPTYSEREFC